MGYRQAIHDLLVTTGFAGAFQEATYTVTEPSLLVVGDPILPQSVEANEIRSLFSIDDEYGREYRQKREAWAWLLVLKFATEAILEDFEESLMQSPLIVARDPGNDVDVQVILLLEDSIYEHPPRGGASNGTLVTYRFVAEQCRQ